MKKRVQIIVCTTILSLYFCIITLALERGDQGDSVRELQEALLQQGYTSVGTADGIFGKATESAVRDFQRQQGLPETGLADDATLSAINSGKQTSKSGSSSSSSSSSTILIPGYDALQSCFLSISDNMTKGDVINLAKKYGLYAYGNKDTSEDVYRFAYIGSKQYSIYNSGSDSYEFDNCDSIEAVFNKITGNFSLSKLYYHSCKKYNGTYPTLEYSVSGNVAGNHYQIVHGYVAYDPTAHYSSAQDALDTLLQMVN